MGLARLRFRLGQYEAAKALGHQALTLAAPNTPVRADAWQVLGNCAAETDSLAEAEVCQVADELWRDKSPAAAQTLFHQATSALRRALEPELPDKFPSRYLLVEGGRVSLQLPPGSVIDFQTFEKHYRAAEWEAAIRTYHGDLLPDFLYADWSIVPRERLKRLYLYALLARARQQMEAGHPHEVLEACYRALEIDSWQEEAVWLGMQASLALHDRAGAIRFYQALERTPPGTEHDPGSTVAQIIRTAQDDHLLDVDQKG